MKIFFVMMLVVIFTGVSHRYQHASNQGVKETVIKAVPQANIAFEHRVQYRSQNSRYQRLLWYTREWNVHEHYFI